MKKFNLIYELKITNLYKNAFHLMANSFVISILGFVFWNVMTKYFTPTEIGVGSSLISVSMLIATFSTLGLGIGIIRFLPEYYNQAGQLIIFSFLISGFAAFVFSLIYILGVNYWSPVLLFVKEDLLMTLFFCVITTFIVISTLIDRVLVAERVAIYVLLKNAIIHILKIPIPIIVFSNMNGYDIFLGLGLATIIGIFISLIWILPSTYKINFFEKPLLPYIDIMKKMFAYSCKNHIANLFSNIPNYIYPLMVLNVLGAKIAGYFYIACLINKMVAVVPGGMAQSLLAEGSTDKNKLSENIKKSLIISFLVTLAIVLFFILLGDFILGFFGDSYVKYGSLIMKLMLVSVMPKCINVIYISVNRVNKRTDLVLKQAISLAILHLGLGYLLLSKFGLIGIGLGCVASELLVAIVIFYPLWKSE